MKKGLSPAAIAVILIVVLVVIGFIGYKMVLAPPPPIHGLVNGKPMTDADINAMKMKMSGGKAGQPSPGTH